MTVIDDNVPCILQGNNPIIASSSAQNHVWPIIIEKAIVKVYGGKYSSLNKHLSESTETILHVIISLVLQLLATYRVSSVEISSEEGLGYMQADRYVFTKRLPCLLCNRYAARNQCLS